MRYAYYPGCSLECTAKAYDVSLRSVFRRLGHELVEIEDWNCCGATAYMSIAETVALAVSARNLVLAERMALDVVAPCSACYTILNKTQRYLREQPHLKAWVGEALAEADLAVQGTSRIRHPLDVLVNDIGIETIAAEATRPLEGVVIAPYYGCQIVRPEHGFDDREAPMWLDRLFARLGAEVADYPPKVRCCGGMLMTTQPDAGLAMSGDLLTEALDSGANVVLTTCPLCHINLEAYQGKLGRRLGRNVRIPVLYFTQLLGLALGADAREVGLPLNLVPYALPEPATAGAAHG